MEQNQQPAALLAADALESIGRALGDIPSSARQIAIHELRRLHARNQELEKDLGNAKRLTSKIWDKHPESRGTIEEGTGAWLVFGQDIETDGVSAQRVTQAADHIAQDRKMVAQEPFGYFKRDSYGWMDCSKDTEGAVALYEAPQPQADASELLEFAKEWLSRRGDDDNYMTAKCRAAIVKAEGGET